MHTLPDVIRRHFAPMLAMLREVIDTCPDEILMQPELCVREHVYHVLVGMDVWLSPDPTAFPFDQIVDDDAAELRGPAASPQISRAFLAAYLDRIEAKVAGLPSEARDYLTVLTMRGHDFTLLDRCLSQVRHTQHHIGVINEKLRVRGCPAVDWQGYGEE